MLDYTPPEPKFWKALFVVAPFVALVTWTVPMLIHLKIALTVLTASAVFAWVVIASIVNSLVANDWRSKYDIDRAQADRKGR